MIFNFNDCQQEFLIYKKLVANENHIQFPRRSQRELPSPTTLQPSPTTSHVWSNWQHSPPTHLRLLNPVACFPPSLPCLLLHPCCPPRLCLAMLVGAQSLSSIETASKVFSIGPPAGTSDLILPIYPCLMQPG